MSHVFISYAHSDRDYARKLADYLLANGFDVWIDDRIDFGSRWIRTIFEAIDASAAFIVIMSPRAYEREMVENERLYAKKRNKIVFPLLLEGEAFPDLGSTQYYDVRGEKLPAQAFLDRLATFAQRSSTVGQDVASGPQQYAAERPRAARRASFILAGAGVIVALAVVMVLIMSVRNNNRTPSTATPPLTEQIGQTSSQVVAASDVPTRVNTTAPTPTDAAEPTLSPTKGDNSAVTVGSGQRQIAFVSNRDGNNEIYLMNLDGTGVTNLTNDPASDEHPSWSPDGTQIAFMSYRDDPSSAVIYIMDADGGNVHRLMSDLTYGYDPVWSPDGTKIAMTFYKEGNAEIYVVNANGNNLHQLTTGAGSKGRPSWSPNGKQIAFEANEDDNHEIYVMDADGSNVQQLTNNPAQDSYPAWSPNGLEILFQSDRDSTNPALYTIRVDSGTVKRIGDDNDDGHLPSWSPGGRQILFSSYRDSNGEELYLMDASGGNVRRLTDSAGNNDSAVWRP